MRMERRKEERGVSNIKLSSRICGRRVKGRNTSKQAAHQSGRLRSALPVFDGVCLLYRNATTVPGLARHFTLFLLTRRIAYSTRSRPQSTTEQRE
jgi:hypothetical protein